MSQFELGEQQKEKFIKIIIISHNVRFLLGPNGGILTSLNLFATKFKKGEN